MPFKIRAHIIKALRKLIFSVGMALLLALLGIFYNMGYHVHSIKENSFNPNRDYSYATNDLSFDATYNPLLYPFYWLMGRGHIIGNFSVTYSMNVYVWGDGSNGEGYAHKYPAQHDTGVSGPSMPIATSSQDRCEDFILSMMTWGLIPNFAFLLLATVAIEIVRQRLLYIILFSGIVGFSLAGITGTVASLLLGILITLIYRFKLPKKNIITEFWNSLWK